MGKDKFCLILLFTNGVFVSQDDLGLGLGKGEAFQPQDDKVTREARVTESMTIIKEGIKPLQQVEALEEKKEIRLNKQESIELGPRKRRSKQAQPFDFQLEMALYESRILAQREKKYQTKLQNKKEKLSLISPPQTTFTFPSVKEAKELKTKQAADITKMGGLSSEALV